MKKKLATIMLVLSLCLGAAFMTACGETPPPANKVVFTFAGSATIETVKYDVTLNAKEDKTFVLSAGSAVTDVTGTYAFVAKQGYVFTFSDATVKSTTFDRTTKTHKFYYTLKVGATGTANVELALKDEAFVPEEEGPVVFTGSVEAMGRVVTYTLALAADGTYTNTCSFNALSTKGTYTFINNVYTIKPEGGTETFSSNYDAAAGTYTIAYTQTGDITVTTMLVYKPNVPVEVVPAVFTGSVEAMGRVVTYTLALAADGTYTNTCSFNALSTKGTYTFINNVYTIKPEGGEETFASVFDAAAGTYTIAYTQTGDITVTTMLVYKPAK